MKAGFTAVAVLLAGPALAQQQDFSKVEVRAEKVADGVYMLIGAGGNIGLSVGKSGKTTVITVVIQAEFATS